MSSSPETASIAVTDTSIQHYGPIRPESGFELKNLSPTLNIIHGPNGCGKSTTAMALCDMIWPGQTAPDYALMSARISQRNQAWEIAYQGPTRTLNSLDGGPANPPLSPPETRSRYLWTLRDLLSGTDTDLAARVAQEMAGGVDFHQLEEELGAASTPSAPRKLQEEYRRIESRLREAKQTQKDLQARAKELEAHHKTLEQLERQASAVPFLDQALERERIRQEHAQAEIEARSFPADMSSLRHGDADRAKQAADTKAHTEKEWEALKRERAELERHEPDWKAFATEDLQRGVREFDRCLHDVSETERDLKDITQDLSDRETKERELRSRLGLSGDAIDKLTGGFSHPDLRRWIQRVLLERSLTEETQALQARVKDTPDEEVPLEDLRNARRELESALTNFIPAIPQLSPTAISAWCLLAIVLIATREHTPKFLILLLALPPLIGLLTHTLRRNVRLSDVRKRVEPFFRFPEPATAESLGATLTELDQAIREAHSRDLDREDQQRLQNRTAELNEVRNEIEAMQEHVRTATDTTTVDAEWLAHFLEDVQRWRTQREDLAEAENRMREAEASHADSKTKLEEAKKVWGASADVDSLLSRLQDDIDRRNSLETLRVKSEALSGTLHKAETDLKQVCERNNLSVDDWEQLISREEMLTDWESVQHTLRLKSEQLKDLNDTLSGHPEWEELSREELTTQREQASTASEQAREQFGELKKLEMSIQQAKEGRDVHFLQEELERKRQELADDRSKALQTHLKREILSWLQDVVRENRRPDVLKAANQYLTRFTKGQLQLSLSFDDGEETFLACRPGEALRSLDTLSGGERAQLLMAVRLAFLDQQESAPLPLFVDEALGTSDDDRADAILDTLISIAKQGRQVFYFTAQTDEVGKWMRALEDESITPAIIDLGALRHGTPSQPIQLSEAREISVEDIMRREGETDSDWALRLGVPAWHPHRSLAELHLFLLFNGEDRELSTCLAYGISSWGALSTLVKANAADNLISASTLAKVQARATALEALTKAWRIGRPKPVPPETVLESGIVSDTFQKPVLDLLRTVEHQAFDLLEALEDKQVSKWRQDKTDALRSYFQEKGYLSDQTPLSKNEMKAQALAHLKDSPHAAQIQPTDWQRLEHLIP